MLIRIVLHSAICRAHTATTTGWLGAEAIRMAIADMGGAINGKKIELAAADHQNKAGHRRAPRRANGST